MKQIILDGIQNYYFITEDGNVYSRFRNGNKLRKKEIDKDGYEKVVLSKGKKQSAQKFFVHRLVALMYIDNPEGYPVVNHLDGNKRNNHYSNLEWTTVQRNTQHAYANNLIKTARNQDHYQSYISNETVKDIYEDYLFNGLSNLEACQKYSISRGVAQSIRNKRSYKNLLSEYPDIGPVVKPLSEDCLEYLCKLFKNHPDEPASYLKKMMSDAGYDITLSRIYKIRRRNTHSEFTKQFIW